MVEMRRPGMGVDTMINKVAGVVEKIQIKD
jgi:hypothetical protein